MSAFIAAATITAVSSIVQAREARMQAKKQLNDERAAREDAKRRALAEKSRQEQEFNRANRKRPGPSRLRAAAQQRNSSGVGSTLLTGAGGAAAGSLGRATLLGAA